MQSMSSIVVPFRDYALFEKAAFERQIGNEILLYAGFAAQSLNLITSGGSRRIARQLALAGFHELLIQTE